MLDQPGQLVVEDGGGGVGEDEVEAVVAVGVAVGLLVVGAEGRVDAVLVAFLGGEGDDGGVAAGEGAAGAGFPRVARGGVVLLDVDMGIDASVGG